MPSALFHPPTTRAGNQSVAESRRLIPSAQHNFTSNKNSLSDLVFKFERLDRLSRKQNTACASGNLKLQQLNPTYPRTQVQVPGPGPVQPSNHPETKKVRQDQEDLKQSTMRTTTDETKQGPRSSEQSLSTSIAARRRLFEGRTPPSSISEPSWITSPQRVKASASVWSETAFSPRLSKTSEYIPSKPFKDGDAALEVSRNKHQDVVSQCPVASKLRGLTGSRSSNSVNINKDEEYLVSSNVRGSNSTTSYATLDRTPRAKSKRANPMTSYNDLGNIGNLELSTGIEGTDPQNGSSIPECPLSSTASTPFQTQAPLSDNITPTKPSNHQESKFSSIPTCCESVHATKSTIGWYPRTSVCHREPVVVTQPAASNSAMNRGKRFSMKLPSHLKDTITLFESLNCQNTTHIKCGKSSPSPERTSSENPGSSGVTATMDGAYGQRWRTSRKPLGILPSVPFPKSEEFLSCNSPSLLQKSTTATISSTSHHGSEERNRHIHGNTWSGQRSGHFSRPYIHDNLFLEPMEWDSSTEPSSNHKSSRTPIEDTARATKHAEVESEICISRNTGTLMTSVKCFLQHPTPVSGAEAVRIENLCGNRAARLRLRHRTE